MPDRGWRDWYQLERWRRRSRHQLKVHPLCAICLQRGQVTPATLADHIQPHKGNWNRFWLSELQSLCKSCHDGPKRMVEVRGYDTAIGVDGYPLDPRHPVYQRRG